MLKHRAMHSQKDTTPRACTRELVSFWEYRANALQRKMREHFEMRHGEGTLEAGANAAWRKMREHFEMRHGEGTLEAGANALQRKMREHFEMRHGEGTLEAGANAAWRKMREHFEMQHGESWEGGSNDTQSTDYRHTQPLRRRFF